MELKKQDAKMLQGLSVLAMVCLHLFCKDHTGLYTPLLYVGGTPVSFYIAQLSDFCVFGFAFLSGYAHMMQSEQEGYYKRRLKGLLSLLCGYWLIVIVFSLIALATGLTEDMPLSWGEFILNFLTLQNTYNGAWWYMFTYILLVVISPVVLKWAKKCHPLIVLGVGFVIYCVSYYVRFEQTAVSNWLTGKLGPFGMTFFEYLLGALAFRYAVFSRIYKLWEKLPRAVQALLAVVITLGLLYGRTKIIPSVFVAPVSGFLLMMLFHFWKKPQAVQKVFSLLGKHSTNIWLTHMFFYAVLFKKLVYLAKYPILILLFMLAITIPVSMLLQWIVQPVQKQIAKI